MLLAPSFPWRYKWRMPLCQWRASWWKPSRKCVDAAWGVPTSENYHSVWIPCQDRNTLRMNFQPCRQLNKQITCSMHLSDLNKIKTKKKTCSFRYFGDTKVITSTGSKASVLFFCVSPLKVSLIIWLTCPVISKSLLWFNCMGCKMSPKLIIHWNINWMFQKSIRVKGRGRERKN